MCYSSAIHESEISMKTAHTVVICLLAFSIAFCNPGPQPTRTTAATATESKSLPAQVVSADLILFNGFLITMQDALPSATGIALRGDRILAVGDDEEVLAFRGLHTQS